MKADFLCLYCGHEWERDWYGSGSPHCPICKDKRIKRKKTRDSVDYYADDMTESEEPGTVYDLDEN